MEMDMIEKKVFKMDSKEKEVLEKFIKDRTEYILIHWPLFGNASCLISMKDSCAIWSSSDAGCLGCPKFKN